MLKTTMTPEQFVYWLKGVMASSSATPDSVVNSLIKTELEKVRGMAYAVGGVQASPNYFPNQINVPYTGPFNGGGITGPSLQSTQVTGPSTQP